MKYLFSALLVIIFLSPAHAQTYAYRNKVKHTSVAIYPFLQDSLYGYADTEGKVVIEPQYKSASLFGNKSQIAELRYRHRSDYRNNQIDFLPSHIAQVRKNNQWQLIDTTGSVIANLGKRQSSVTEVNYYKYRDASKGGGPRRNGLLSGYRIDYLKDSIKQVIFYHIGTNSLSKSYKYVSDFQSCQEGKSDWWSTGRVIGSKDACYIRQTLEGQYDILSNIGEELQQDIDPSSLCDEEKLDTICDGLITIRDEKLKEKKRKQRELLKEKWKQRNTVKVKKEKMDWSKIPNDTGSKYFLDTHIYMVSEGDSICYYSDKGHKVFTTFKNTYYENISYINKDRILITRKNGYTLLNGYGEELDRIEVYSGITGHRNRVPNFLIVKIAGRQMIVFTEKAGRGRFIEPMKDGRRPFLYDPETLKEFRN